MKKIHVKTGDTVVLLSGKQEDKFIVAEDGTKKIKTGVVKAVSPEEGKVIVEGFHVVHKHTKARSQGETSAIVDTEGAIYACKVALYCPDCQKGVRAKHIFADGKKVRVCAKCGKEI